MACISPTARNPSHFSSNSQRLGNWLTAEQARTLWQLPNAETVKGKRDRAILSILLGCGLRRRELAELTLDHLQQREDHWAVVDLIVNDRIGIEPVQ